MCFDSRNRLDSLGDFAATGLLGIVKNNWNLESKGGLANVEEVVNLGVLCNTLSYINYLSLLYEYTIFF